MDNLTHTLLAVALSRAGLNRLSPHATALLVAGANAPDVDLVVRLLRPSSAMAIPGAHFHSLVMAPLIAAAVTLLVRVIRRGQARWTLAYAVALAGVASNPLLELAGSHGVRLLWPFSGRWFRGDLVAAFDLWIWLILALGLVAPWFSRLVSREMGAKPSSGRGTAIFVLVLLSGYLGGRYLLHARALATLDSHMYLGVIPARVAAVASPVDPFAWTGLVEGATFYQRHAELHLLRRFDPSKGTTFYKPEAGRVLERAREAPEFRAILDFAGWPVWRVFTEPEPEGAVRIELSDLRFGPPGGSRYSVSALFDPQGRPTGAPGRQ